MAERLFRQAAPARHEARSVGSNPGMAVHPQVLKALAEIALDASDHVPRKLDDDAVEWADVVVATCDGACPVIPGKHYVSWHLPDPKDEPVERVREIRDEIGRLVGTLIGQLDQPTVAG